MGKSVKKVKNKEDKVNALSQYTREANRNEGLNEKSDIFRHRWHSIRLF